ncbi:hypothetical protein [Mycoplasmopsis edwardii]|nr:hypothetical protein [Mycoplasmopsis edwardii]
MKRSVKKNIFKKINLIPFLGLTTPFLASCSYDKKVETEIQKNEVKKIEFSKVTQNKATIIIELKNNINANAEESYINVSGLIDSYDIYSNPEGINNNKIIFTVNNLQQDSRYFIKSLTINNEKVEIPNWIKTDFQTISNDNELLIKNIEVYDIDHSNAKLKINYSSKNDSLISKIKFEFEPNLKYKMVSYQGDYAIYSITNLKPKTKYMLKSVKLDNNEILYSPNNVSFITPENLKNQNNEQDKPTTSDSDNKNIFVNNFELINDTETSVTIRVYFSKLFDKSQRNFLEITLSDDKYQTSNVINYDQNYVDFVINSLKPNTNYRVLEIKLNSNKLSIQKQFDFVTREYNNNNNHNNDHQNIEKNEPSISSYTTFYNDELNVVEKDSQNFENIKNDPKLNNYFNFIKKSKSNIPNEKFERKEQSEIIDLKITNNILKVKIKINSNYDHLKLKIERKRNISFIDQKNNKNNIAEFEIQNIQNGENINIIGLFQNDEEINNFKNKNFSISNKKVNEQSGAFTFQNLTEWKLWEASSSQYSFAIDVWRSVSNIEWPNAFALRIINNQNKIEYIDLNYVNKRSEAEPRRVEAYFERSKVNKVLNLVLKNGNEYYDLTNFDHVIEKPNANDGDKISNFNINSVSVTNNIVNVNYTNDIQSSINYVDFLVKSTNPFQPWSKIIRANIDHNQKISSFNTEMLPKNISKYIIVATKLQNEVIDYGLNEKYKFAVNNSQKEFNLLDFRIIKDENKKQLLASAIFDFEQEDFAFFEDKWFQFTFEPEVDESSKEYYGFNFVTEYKINVPFKNLWKFGLNGFYENTKYSLKSIKVIEPFTQDLYYENISISSNLKKDFIYKFNYPNTLNNYVIKSDKVHTEFNFNDSDLITKNLNLQKQDLINIWLSNETKSKIPYSIQNHYALIEYERCHFYKNAAGSIKPRKNFIMINEEGNEVNLRVIAGRKILDNAVPILDDNHKKVTITENIDQYNGLSSIGNEAIFIFRLELDNHKRKLSETTPLDPASTTAKSFISIPISYKDIKQKQVIDDATFTFLQTRGDIRIHEVISKQIKDRFQFKVSLADNNLKLEIIPKYDNVLIFDKLSDHYFSLANSTFIGNVSTTLHWIKTINNNHEISFSATPLKDNLSTSLNETFINNENKGNDKLFEKNITLKNKQESTKRLYKEDKTSSTEHIRSRSFSFQNVPNGTWSVMGKVKPHDDLDYNYYVVSNSHVWKVFAKKSGVSIDGNEYKVLNNTWFKVPIITEKPENINDSNPTPYFDNSNVWNLNGVEFKIESIVDFDDDSYYPHPSDFKDTYAESIKTNTGKDPWLLGRADLIVAKVDMSFFFKNFSLETLDQATYNGIPLNERQKEIIKFFLNWKNLPFVEISSFNHHLSEYYNLNWFTAPYPGLASNNKDSRKGKRYREYLLGNTNNVFSVVSYLGATSKNLLVQFDTDVVDIAGGASGTTVYDSKNKIAGFVVEATKGAKKDEKGVSGIFVVDGHKYKFIGDGTTPQNPASFYERVRLLSYLYPERYENTNFLKTPKIYNIDED